MQVGDLHAFPVSLTSMQRERDTLHPSRESKSTKLQCRLKVDREHSVLPSDFMAMKNFTYQVEKLIKCVQERPAIWDKTLEVYKDKAERKQAWEEIFRCLEEGYDDLTRQEKRTKSDIIINKWTNIRDTFIKSVRVQAMKGGTKRYIYYNELSFLLKNTPRHFIPESNDNSVGSEGDDDPISFSTYVPGLKRERDEASSSTSLVVEIEPKRTKKTERQSRKTIEMRDSSPESDYKPRRRSRKSDPNPEEPVDFVEMSEGNDPRVMNEDEAFFASLLPSVVKYSEDERLEFRIEVLAVMKSINSKRRHMWGETTN